MPAHENTCTRPPTNAREVACADIRPRGLPREDLRSGLLRRPPRHHGLLSKGAAGHPATLKPPRPAAARGFSWPPLSPDKKGGPPRAWAGSRPRSRGAGEGGAGMGGLRGECGAQRPGSLLRVQLVRTPGSQSRQGGHVESAHGGTQEHMRVRHMWRVRVRALWGDLWSNGLPTGQLSKTHMNSPCSWPGIDPRVVWRGAGEHATQLAKLMLHCNAMCPTRYASRNTIVLKKSALSCEVVRCSRR